MGNIWTFPFTALLQSLWYAAGIIGIWELIDRLRSTRSHGQSVLVDLLQLALPIAGLFTWYVISGHFGAWILVLYAIAVPRLVSEASIRWLYGVIVFVLGAFFLVMWQTNGVFALSSLGGAVTLAVAYALHRRGQSPYWSAAVSALWVASTALYHENWTNTADELVTLLGFAVPLFIYTTEKHLHIYESPNRPLDLDEPANRQDELDNLRRTILNLPIGIVITTKDHIIIEANDEFVKLSGYARSQLLGKKPSMMAIPNLDNHALYQAMRNRLETAGIWEGEFVNRKPNGEVWTAHTTISPLRIQDTPVGYMALVTPLQSDVEADREAAGGFLAEVRL